jgi:uncharacterized membrane protein YcaP (DUF421 family)
METVLSAAAIYFFLLIVFSISGKRSLAQIDTFDFVLLLIVGECTQQALSGKDYSLTGSFLLVGTLVALELMMSALKQRWPLFEKLSNGGPLIVVAEGKLLEERLHREKIGKEEILAAARECHGLQRMDQIRYAVLEASGRISIIPYSGAPK